MFNAASKLSFTVAVAAAAAGFAAVFVTSDRVAFTALVFAGVLAAAVGLAVFYFAPRDPVVPASAEVEAAAVRSVDVADLPRPSLWPFVAAVAVTLAAIGAATGKRLIVIAVVVSVLVVLGWLAQVWREHPSWTQAMSDRLNDRFVVPIGLPLLVAALTAIGAVSLSRIFLAVSADAAPIIGIVIAFIVLGAFYLISTRERLDRPMLITLVGVAAVLVLGAGVAGSIAGEREFHEAGAATHGESEGEHDSGEAVERRLSASDLAFDTEELDLPASAPIVLAFHNEESDESIEHNVSIYEEEGGENLFRGDFVAGGEEVEYEFESPAAGTYYFQCDNHPDMHGAVEVTEDATAEEGESVNVTTSTSQDH